jgi:hypothetical protein
MHRFVRRGARHHGESQRDESERPELLDGEEVGASARAHVGAHTLDELSTMLRRSKKRESPRYDARITPRLSDQWRPDHLGKVTP